MNHDGHAYDGIVYSQNLKKVPKPGFSTIKNIISFSRKKNSFKVTFQNFDWECSCHFLFKFYSEP